VINVKLNYSSCRRPAVFLCCEWVSTTRDPPTGRGWHGGGGTSPYSPVVLCRGVVARWPDLWWRHAGVSGTSSRGVVNTWK